MFLFPELDIQLKAQPKASKFTITEDNCVKLWKFYIWCASCPEISKLQQLFGVISSNENTTVSKAFTFFYTSLNLWQDLFYFNKFQDLFYSVCCCCVLSELFCLFVSADDKTGPRTTDGAESELGTDLLSEKLGKSSDCLLLSLQE